MSFPAERLFRAPDALREGAPGPDAYVAPRPSHLWRAAPVPSGGFRRVSVSVGTYRLDASVRASAARSSSGPSYSLTVRSYPTSPVACQVPPSVTRPECPEVLARRYVRWPPAYPLFYLPLPHIRRRLWRLWRLFFYPDRLNQKSRSARPIGFF